MWPIHPGVPRLDRILAVQNPLSPSYCHLRPAPSDPAALIHPKLLAALESDSETLRAEARTSHALVQLTSLEMAAVRDLEGARIDQLSDHYGFTERRTKQLVSDGRRRWMGIGAWPWTYLRCLRDRPGGPDTGWLTDGYVVDAFHYWEADGRLQERVAVSLAPTT